MLQHMDAWQWASASEGSEPPSEAYCPTRDIAAGRVSKLLAILENQGVPINQAALIAAVAGELTNNCFDHNIGNWPDVPGCWFEYSVQLPDIHIIISDRGQGFLRSLQRVRNDLKDHKEALILAFQENTSGRAPERRGNGLPFSLKSLNQLAETKFVLQTGNARLEFQSPIAQEDISTYTRVTKEVISGTYAEILCVLT